MNQPTMETVVRRLDRVERENRRMKQAGAVALAVIGAVVLMGQATKVPKWVEAEKFIIRDANGKLRGELGMQGELPGLSLIYNKEMTFNVLVGEKDALLVIEKSRPGMHSEVGLYIDDDDSARITVSRKGRGKAVLGSVSLETTRTGVVEKRPESSLVLIDKAGNVIWSAP